MSGAPQVPEARAGAGGGLAPSPLRAVVWLLHIALPALGLWLLLARPELDAVWEHQTAHFWLVVDVAGANVVLGGSINREAAAREDARLFLVLLAFLVNAGFLLLHALATPTVIVPGPNAGFQLSTPVGLVLAALLAAASSIELGGFRGAEVMRRRWVLLGASATLMGAWGVVSLAGLAPLRDPIPPEQLGGVLLVPGVVAIALYAWAAARYDAVYRRRPRWCS